MNKSTSLLLCFFLSTISAFSQLTGMSLTSARVNTSNLSTSITSNNAFLVSGSPNGNIYQIELRKPGSTILLADGNTQYNVYTSVVVHTPDSLTFTPFSIPYNAVPGTYSLYVGYLDPMLQYQWNTPAYYDSLPNAFTVLPPDGYIQGTVFEDLNQNGVLDAGESGINNGSLTITPLGGYYPIASNGTFSIPAMNGSYTLTWNRSTSNNMYLTNNSPSYFITVNNGNVTQRNFPLKRKLRFVSPNQLVQGQAVRVTLVGDTMISNPSSVNIQRQGGGGSYTFYTGNISVVDSSTASILMTLPTNAAIGTYNLYLRNNSLPYSGYHYLYGALTVIPSTASISGRTYYDSNNNGVYDSGEPPLRSQRVHLMPEDAYAWSNDSGQYTMGSLFGNHTIAYDPVSVPFVIGTGPASYTFTSSGPVTGKDFGMITTNPDYSTGINFYTTRPRCNTNNVYTIRATNAGNLPYNGRIYIKRDMQTVWNGSTPAANGSTASGDTIWWNVQNLQPFTPYSITLALLMPGPGTGIINRVWFESYDAGNNVQTTASANISETVLCSYDPNDKACTPEGVGPQHYTLINQELEYLVRFQNTGNDTAYDVNIYDRLDTSLDWATLQMVDASHSCITTLDSVGQVRFRFSNIFLPDSNVNEPASNGFVRYRIRPKSNIDDYTEVRNTAYIVFDLNPAVVTNTTFNTLVTAIPLGIGEATGRPSATVFPNPVTTSAHFVLNNRDGEWALFEVAGVDGKPVYRTAEGNGDVVFDRDRLPAGVYGYRFLSKDGTVIASGRFVVE